MEVGNEVRTNEVSAWFLINIIFEGNGQRALDVSRQFARSSYTLTPTTVERYLIREQIKDGDSDEKIVQDLSRDGHKINIDRVKRIRDEMRQGKHGEEYKINMKGTRIDG
jgi:hypothetical protein